MGKKVVSAKALKYLPKTSTVNRLIDLANAVGATIEVVRGIVQISFKLKEEYLKGKCNVKKVEENKEDA